MTTSEKANESQCHHCHHEEHHVLHLLHSRLDVLEFLIHLGISMLLVVIRVWSRTRARLLNGRLVQFFFDICGTMILFKRSKCENKLATYNLVIPSLTKSRIDAFNSSINVGSDGSQMFSVRAVSLAKDRILTF